MNQVGHNDRTINTRALCVVLAGGGTGGHLFPLLAVSEAIGRAAPESQFDFYSTERAVDDDILKQYGCDIIRQPVRPVPKHPWKWPGFFHRWRASVRQCRRSFTSNRPDIVVGSGGFGSGPPIHVAQKMNIPTVILNPDAVPGRANRFLSERAQLVCSQWDDTTAHFSERVQVVTTGCPVRSTFRAADAARGRQHFQLDDNRKTLLITGASHGARSINDAVLGMLQELKTLANWQFLHLTGRVDFARVKAAYEESGIFGHVVEFTDRMPDALAAADLVVARAGASTLAEITALGKPSILLPYPHHSDMHQLANARCLVRAGAARIVHDRVQPEQNVAELKPLLTTLMNDEKELQRMSAHAQKIGRLDAATNIATLIIDLVNADQNRRGGGKS
jgi:UDP-N-acetylglucosamine--N-acetylmuramyl-(pentapeptide) pyrophosphoryl-undecaprenol N-acetylglucosamine transferase